MDSKSTGLQVGGCLLALICVAQLVRLVIQPEIVVAGHLLPLWPSMLAVIVLGGVAFWMWNLSRRAV